MPNKAKVLSIACGLVIAAAIAGIALVTGRKVSLDSWEIEVRKKAYVVEPYTARVTFSSDGQARSYSSDGRLLASRRFKPDQRVEQLIPWALREARQGNGPLILPDAPEWRIVITARGQDGGALALDLAGGHCMRHGEAISELLAALADAVDIARPMLGGIDLKRLECAS